MSARTQIRHWKSRKIDDNLLRQVAPSPRPSTSDETAAQVGCSTTLKQEDGTRCDCNIDVTKNEVEDPRGLCDDLSGNKCDFCDRSFKCYIDLTRHLKDHHVKEPAMDSDTKKSSTSTASSSLVKSYKHKTGAFKCQLCDKVYKYNFDLNRHVNDIHVNKLKQSKGNKKLNEKIKIYVKKYLPFKCKACGKMYVSQSKLSHHMNRVHSREAAATAKCVKEISDRSKKLLSLISNIKSKNATKSGKKTSKPTSSNKTPTLKGNKVMSPKRRSKDKGTVKKKTVQPKVPSHGTLLHPKVGLSSLSCEESPVKKASTKVSDKRMHPIEEIHEKSQKKLKCNLCQKTYTTRPGVMYHLKVTHLYCVVCYKQFCYQKIYDKHMQIKHNQHHIVIDDNYFSNLSKESKTMSVSTPENTKVKPHSVDVKAQNLEAKDCTEKMLASSRNSATRIGASPTSSHSSSSSCTVKIPDGTLLSPIKIKLNRLPSDPASLQNIAQNYAIVSNEKTKTHGLESFPKTRLDMKKSNCVNSVASTGPKDMTVTNQQCQDTTKPDNVCEKPVTRSKLGPKSKQKSSRISYGLNVAERTSQPCTVSDELKVEALPNETDKCDKEHSKKMKEVSVYNGQNFRKTRSRLRNEGQGELSMECSGTEDTNDKSSTKSDRTTVKSSLKYTTSTERITRSSSQPVPKENPPSDGITTENDSQPERKDSTECSASSSSSATRDMASAELDQDKTVTNIDPVMQANKNYSRRTTRKDRSSSEPSNSSRSSRRLTLTGSSQSIHSTVSPSSKLTTEKTASSEFTPYAHSTKGASASTTKKHLPSSEPARSSRKLTNSSKPLTSSTQSSLKDNTSEIPSNVGSISTKNNLSLTDPTSSPGLASEEYTDLEAEDISRKILEENTGSEAEDTSHRILEDTTESETEVTNNLIQEENTGSEAEDSSQIIEQTSLAEKPSSSSETRTRQESPIEYSTLHSRCKVDDVSYDYDIRELLFGKSCRACDLHVDDQPSPEHHDDYKWRIVHEEKSYDLNKLTLKITRDVKTDVRSVETQEKFICNLSGLKLKIVRDFSKQRRTVLSDDDQKCQGKSNIDRSDIPQAKNMSSSVDGLSSGFGQAISDIQRNTLSAMGDNFSSVTSDSDDFTSPSKSDVKDRNNVSFAPRRSDAQKSSRQTRFGNKHDEKATQRPCSGDTTIYKSHRTTDSVNQQDVISQKSAVSFGFEKNLEINSDVGCCETDSRDARSVGDDDMKLVRNTGDISAGSGLATVTNVVGSSGDRIKKTTTCRTIVGPAGDNAVTSVSDLSVRNGINQDQVEKEFDVIDVQLKTSDSELQKSFQNSNMKGMHCSGDNSWDISMHQHQHAGLKVLEKSPGKKLQSPGKKLKIDSKHHDPDNILTLCSKSFGNLLQHVEERGVAKVLVEKLQDSVTVQETLPNSSLKKRGMSKLDKPAPACVKKQRLAQQEVLEKTLNGSSIETMAESEKYPETENMLKGDEAKMLEVSDIVHSQVSSDSPIDEINGEHITSPNMKIGHDLSSGNMTVTQEGLKDSNGAKVLMGDTIGQHLLEDFDESDLDLLLEDDSCGDLFSDTNVNVTLSDDGLYASVNTPLGDANNNHFKGKVIKEIMEIIQFASPGIFQTNSELGQDRVNLEGIGFKRKSHIVEKMENFGIVKSPNTTEKTGSVFIENESKDEQTKNISSSGQLDSVEKIPEVNMAGVMIESSLTDGHMQQGKNETNTKFRNINITKKGVGFAGKNESMNQSEESKTISDKEKNEIPTEKIPLNKSSGEGSKRGRRSVEDRLLKKNPSVKAGDHTFSLRCTVCGNSFSSVKNLERHQVRYHPEDFRKRQKHSVVCKLCGMLYANKQNLKRHIASRHPETFASSDKAFKLICEEIETDSNPSSNLNSKTKETYDMNIQYRCLLCDITYKNLSSVICHIESSHKKRKKPVKNCYTMENLNGSDNCSKSQAQETVHSSVESSKEHLKQAQESVHSSLEISKEQSKLQSCNIEPNMDESEAAVHNLLESFGEETSLDFNTSQITDSSVTNSPEKQGSTGEYCHGVLGYEALEEERQDQLGSQAEHCCGGQQDQEQSEIILQEPTGDKNLEYQGGDKSKTDGEKEPECQREEKQEQERNENQKASGEEGEKDQVMKPLSDPSLDVVTCLSETISSESTLQCPPVQEVSDCTEEEIYLEQNSYDVQQDLQPSQNECKSDDKICKEVADQTGFHIHQNCTVKLVRFPLHSSEAEMGDFLLRPKSSGRAVVWKINTISSNTAPNNLNLSVDVNTRPPKDCTEDEVEGRTQNPTIKDAESPDKSSLTKDTGNSARSAVTKDTENSARSAVTEVTENTARSAVTEVTGNAARSAVTEVTENAARSAVTEVTGNSAKSSLTIDTENPTKLAVSEEQSRKRFVCELCGLSYANKKGLKRHICNKHPEAMINLKALLKAGSEDETVSSQGKGHFTQIQTISETTNRKTKNTDLSHVVHKDKSKKSLMDCTDGSMCKNTSGKEELALTPDSQPDILGDKSDDHSDVPKNKLGDGQEVTKERSNTQTVLESTLTNQPVVEESVEPGPRKRTKLPKTKKDKEKSKSKIIKVVTSSSTLTSSSGSTTTCSAITDFEMAISTPAYSQPKLKKRKLDQQISSEGPPSKQQSSDRSKDRTDEKSHNDPEERLPSDTDERFPSESVDLFPGNMEEVPASSVGDGLVLPWQRNTEFQSGSDTTSPRKIESPNKSKKKSIDKIVQGIIQRQKDNENKKIKEKLDPPEVDFPAPFEEILAQSKHKAAKPAEVTESTLSLNDDYSNSSGSVKSAKLLTKSVDMFSSLQMGSTVKFGKSFRRASSKTTALSDGEPQQSFKSPLDRVGVEMPMNFRASQESKNLGKNSSKAKQQSNKNYLIDILKDIPSIYDYSNDEGPYVSPWDNPSVSKAGKSIIGGNKPPTVSKVVHFGSEINDTAADQSNDDHVLEFSNDTTMEICNEDSDMDISDDEKLETKPDLLQNSLESMPDELEEEKKDDISAAPDNDEETQNFRKLADDEGEEPLSKVNSDEGDSDVDHRYNDTSDNEGLSDDGQSNKEEEEEPIESDCEKEEEEYDFMFPSTPPSKPSEKNFSDEEKDILSIDYDSDEASFLGDEDDVGSVISKKSISKRRSLVAVELELQAVEKSSVAVPTTEQANESTTIHSKIQSSVPSALTPAVVSKAASIFSGWGGYCHNFLLHGNCRRGNSCRFQHAIPPLEWFYKQGQASILNSRQTQNKDRAFEVYQLLKTLNVRPITRDVVEVLLQLAVNVWDTDAAFQLFGDLKSTDLINNMTSSMLVRLCNSCPQNYTDQLWALFQVVLEKNLKLDGTCLDTVIQAFSMRREYMKLWEVLLYCNSIPYYVVPMQVLHVLLFMCLKSPEEYLPAINKWAETCNHDLLHQLEHKILMELYDISVKYNSRVLSTMLEQLIATQLPENQGELPETTDILGEQDWNGDNVDEGPITSSDEYLGRQHRIRGCKLTKNWEHLGSIFVELCCDLELSNPNYIEEYIYVLTDTVKPASMAQNFKFFLQAVHKELETKMADNMDVLDEPSLARIGAGLIGLCYQEGLWEEGYHLLYVMHQTRVYYHKCTGHRAMGTALIAMEICLNAHRPESALQILQRSKGQIMTSENGANVTRILENLFDRLLEKSFTKMAFSVLVIIMEKQEQDQIQTDLSGYFNCLVQKSLATGDIHTAFGVYKIEKETNSGKLDMLGLRGLLTACGKHRFDNKYIKEVYESCVTRKLYPPQILDTPRSVVLWCMMTPVEMYLYISDYLNVLYNTLCECVMGGAHLTMDDFCLTVHVWWEENPLQQIDFPYLSLAPQSQQEVWHMALYVLNKNINPPLQAEFNQNTGCICVNPESLYSYLQEKDRNGRKQGLHIQTSQPGTGGPAKMRGRAWARPQNYSNRGQGRPYR